MKSFSWTFPTRSFRESHNQTNKQDASCVRCLSGRGGYRFDWVGLWTHRDIIVPIGINPAEHRRTITRALPPHLPRTSQETAMDIICPESTARPKALRREDLIGIRCKGNIMIIATNSEEKEASSTGPSSGVRIQPTHLEPASGSPSPILRMNYTIQTDGSLIMERSESGSAPNPSSRRQRRRRMIDRQ